MSAQIINRTDSEFTVQITVPYNRSMLDFEETVQQQLNAAGVLSTQEGLRQFDTDGSPITVGSIKLTSKGQLPKDYQTPYGKATVERHVYQGPRGGVTYCPLDRDARIIVSSTPKFAKMISSKYAEFGSARVQTDLRDNHGRTISRCLVQDVADAVAAVALVKEEVWSYHLPKSEMPPTTVALSLDGTCMLMCEDGWRETMVGTISFYDREGERQHTIYLAATPEYGKATFLGRLEAEITHVKATYPEVHYLGIADEQGQGEHMGSSWSGTLIRRSWTFGMRSSTWEKRRRCFTEVRSRRARRGWTRVVISSNTSLGVPRRSWKRLKYLSRRYARGPKRTRMCSGRSPISQNQSKSGRMDYAMRVIRKEPIGSGVTEAACKVIVKQRLCSSGMKWKEAGAAAVLSLRCLTHTPERWDQFWGKIDKWGFPVAA